MTFSNDDKPKKPSQDDSPDSVDNNTKISAENYTKIIKNKVGQFHRFLDHQSLMGIFSEYAESTPPSAEEVSQFLKYIAYGDQEKAYEMLEAKPLLVLSKGDVTDLSGRTFKNITGLQYAAWALDEHMWNMLKPYLPKEEIAKQLNEVQNGLTYTVKILENKKDKTSLFLTPDDENYQKFCGDKKNDIIIEKEITESHYNFQIVNALQEFLNFVEEVHKKRNKAWSQWTDEEREAAFEKCSSIVGGALRTIPAHIANWYCSKDSFESPNFDAKNKLSRSLVLDGYHYKLYPLYNSDHRPKLGFSCGFIKGKDNNIIMISSLIALHVNRLKLQMAYDKNHIQFNLKAMILLQKTRLENFNEFIKEYPYENQTSQNITSKK